MNKEFGNNSKENNKKMELMLNLERINNIQNELLKKMKDQIQFGLGALDGKDKTKMHVEKVPIEIKS
jgi:hypothetical protein